MTALTLRLQPAVCDTRQTAAWRQIRPDNAQDQAIDARHAMHYCVLGDSLADSLYFRVMQLNMTSALSTASLIACVRE